MAGGLQLPGASEIFKRVNELKEQPGGPVMKVTIDPSFSPKAESYNGQEQLLKKKEGWEIEFFPVLNYSTITYNWKQWTQNWYTSN